MPTSLPAHSTRTARSRFSRKAPLGWAWSDWGLLLAAYAVVICAVLFAAPDHKASAVAVPPGISAQN